MNFSIITEYSPWFILLCLMGGVAYSALLYFRSPANEGINRNVRYFLMAIRFIYASVLFFFLLGPLLKRIFRIVEKPVIILAQDNSLSIRLSSDSIYLWDTLKPAWIKLGDGLRDDYLVKTCSFGEKYSDGIPFTLNDKTTDISGLFNTIGIQYSDRNVGAIIIASDGIYNAGSNPIHSPLKINAPVFTLALGDTVKRKDIIISKVNYNRIAYLGNYFPLEIILHARHCKGNRTAVSVKKKDEPVFSQDITITGNNQSMMVPVRLKADETGIHRFHIECLPIDGEATGENNYANVYIDVLDNRQRVLILARSPHPDIAAMRQAIGTNENYETDVFLTGDFPGGAAKYNLVILHQLPSSTADISGIIKDIVTNKVPVLYVIGLQTAIPAFNNLGTGLTLSVGSKGGVNEALPVINGNFNLFSLDEGFISVCGKLPPLLCHFGTYQSAAGNEVLFNQKIGTVPTSNPLILFNYTGEAKCGIITGEGLWKWRMMNFSVNNSHEVFDGLFNKIIQYLSVKADKSFFRISMKNHFNENEAVVISAEAYNETYELINTPDVVINIISAEGKKYPFTFSRTTNGYYLSCGYLQPGEYRYDAVVRVGEKVHTKKGIFVVAPVTMEAVNTVADHNFLSALARKYGGELIYPDEIGSLPGKIRQRQDIKPVSYMNNEMVELINFKWIAGLLLFLLSLEWFLRKRSGSY